MKRYITTLTYNAAKFLHLSKGKTSMALETNYRYLYLCLLAQTIS